MDHEKQKHAAGATDGVPTFLTLQNTFHPTDLERVIKDKVAASKLTPCFFWFDRFLAPSQENTRNS